MGDENDKKLEAEIGELEKSIGVGVEEPSAPPQEAAPEPKPVPEPSPAPAPSTAPATPPAEPPKSTLTTEEQPTDEDKAGLEEIPDKQKQALIRERIQRRKDKESYESRLKELESKVTQVTHPSTSGGTQPGTASPTPARMKPLTSDEVGLAFTLMAEAESLINDGVASGRVTTEDQAKTILQNAQTALTTIDNPQLIVQVIDAARTGRFGEQGRKIAELAQKELPLAQARYSQAQAEAQRGMAAAQELNTKINAAVQKQHEMWKELADQNSEQAKFALAWIKDNVGPALREAIAENPETEVPKVFKMIRDSWDGKSVSGIKTELDKAKAELAELKKRLSVSDQPIAGSSAPSDAGGKKISEIEELEKQIEATTGGPLYSAQDRRHRASN